MNRRAARPQPKVAKRMECVQLAGAVVRAWALESGSKPSALHTLREEGRVGDFVAGCEQVGLLQCRAARPQPKVAKRMECAQLAGAVVRGWARESGSKLSALHTLREEGRVGDFVAGCEQVGLLQC